MRPDNSLTMKSHHLLYMNRITSFFILISIRQI
ncbi:hypothetical protein ABIE50_000110 [Chitinophaga sp. OAE865]